MILHCPFCAEDFDSSALVVEQGITGAVRCPKCRERVSISSPYGFPVAIASLLVAFVVLVLLNVRTILGFVIGTVMIWLPTSLLLNAASVRIKGPILKKWKPRHLRTRKTFFERLYERSAPPELFGKRRR